MPLFSSLPLSEMNIFDAYIAIVIAATAIVVAAIALGISLFLFICHSFSFTCQNFVLRFYPVHCRCFWWCCCCCCLTITIAIILFAPQIKTSVVFLTKYLLHLEESPFLSRSTNVHAKCNFILFLSLLGLSLSILFLLWLPHHQASALLHRRMCFKTLGYIFLRSFFYFLVFAPSLRPHPLIVNIHRYRSRRWWMKRWAVNNLRKNNIFAKQNDAAFMNDKHVFPVLWKLHSCFTGVRFCQRKKERISMMNCFWCKHEKSSCQNRRRRRTALHIRKRKILFAFRKV